MLGGRDAETDGPESFDVDGEQESFELVEEERFLPCPVVGNVRLDASVPVGHDAPAGRLLESRSTRRGVTRRLHRCI